MPPPSGPAGDHGGGGGQPRQLHPRGGGSLSKTGRVGLLGWYRSDKPATGRSLGVEEGGSRTPDVKGFVLPDFDHLRYVRLVGGAPHQDPTPVATPLRGPVRPSDDLNTNTEDEPDETPWEVEGTAHGSSGVSTPLRGTSVPPEGPPPLSTPAPPLQLLGHTDHQESQGARGVRSTSRLNRDTVLGRPGVSNGRSGKVSGSRGTG